MKRALFIGVLTASLGVSAGAYAQAPVATLSTSKSSFSVTAGELAAIGGGALIGGALFDLVVPIRFAYIIGGLAGAYVGYAWYTQSNQ